MKLLIPFFEIYVSFLTKVNENAIFCATAIPLPESHLSKNFEWLLALVGIGIFLLLLTIAVPFSFYLGVVSLIGALIMSLKIGFDNKSKRQEKGCAWVLFAVILVPLAVILYWIISLALIY
jgi:hypothetical protein